GRIGPLSQAERETVIQRSPYAGKYDTAVDRESAHEMLTKRRAELAAQKEAEAQDQASSAGGWANVIFGRGPRGGRSLGEQVARDVSRSIMRRMIGSVTRAAMRGLGLRH
ncbi:MAG: DUF853 domain-containing protein, partial [Alphaproteobacteria bacterium]|nr:DUF853 domain-containing protein [Alphaproteobacteria bacterium]